MHKDVLKYIIHIYMFPASGSARPPPPPWYGPPTLPRTPYPAVLAVTL